MRLRVSFICILGLILACNDHLSLNKQDSEQRDVSANVDEEVNWHLFGENGINIKPAWAITKGTKNVAIGVVDSGFLPHHDAFTKGECHSFPHHVDYHIGRPVSQQYKFTPNHGTSVASIISTCDKNPVGLIGINNNADIHWFDSPGDLNYLLHAFEKATETTHIINTSLGDESTNPFSGRSFLLPKIEKANAQSRIVVASAGNAGHSADKHFPANAPGIISVGFTDKAGKAHQFSNWGEMVDILAPGENIPVASLDGKKLASGSSFAAPIVTAVISLMHTVYPALNWKTAVYFMQSTAVPMTCEAYCVANRSPDQGAECRKDCCRGKVQVCTPGRLDAGRAVQAAERASIRGLPDIALVDSDKYLVPLTEGKGEFTLTNVGGGAGKYHITSPDGGFTFSDNETALAPDEKRTIQVTKTDQFSIDSKIRVASPESGIVNTFSDELILYVK